MNIQIEVALIGLVQAMAIAVIAGIFARDSKKRKGAVERSEEMAALRAEEGRKSMALVIASVNVGIQTGMAVKEGKSNGGLTEALEHAKAAADEYKRFIEGTAAKKLSGSNK